MEIDFNIYDYDYNDRTDMMTKDNIGVVKCKKEFPIYTRDGKQYLFKPLSRTKPLTTPLFGFSEVFWSNIINSYFDKNAPLYRLAICHGYSKEHPSRYDEGTIVESIINKDESLVNLLEYYHDKPDKKVDIENYINYCGVYYDYTHILESDVFKNNPQLSKELAKQILISILKNDINYHYENVAFVYQDDKLKRLAPPIDHEFSLYFLFPDEDLWYYSYFGQFNKTLMENDAPEDNVKFNYIINNIQYIREHYPDVLKEFLSNLKRFIVDFSNYNLNIPNDYMRPFATDLYKVYEAIYKEHKDSKKLHEIEKFQLHTLDMNEYSKQIQHDILTGSTFLYANLDGGPTLKKTSR